jgi:hypothetical protein
MKLILIFGVCLLCVSAFADTPTYSGERAWVESHNATNTVPKDERLFIVHDFSGDYTSIIRYHKGISLREVVDQTPFKGKTVDVIVMRPEKPPAMQWMSPDIVVKPSEKSDFVIRPLDVIWIFDKPPAFT